MNPSYFFCGIGGSGMSALAAILAQQGAHVSGSDRARDRGDSPAKFTAMEKLGFRLFPQDGTGISGDITALVVSSAVEDSIPDIKAAKEKGINIIKRAALLAALFNESKTRIAVAGTSGKSTVTGMIAVMLAELGRDPTVMNGGLIRNFQTPAHQGLANMRAGQDGIFVTEADESDGSIALYNPSVAVLNNISLDHKGLDELDVLFGDFIGRAQCAVLNFDDEKVLSLKEKSGGKIIGYGIDNANADLRAENIRQSPGGVEFAVAGITVRLKTPGRHNVTNALAALAVGKAMGLGLKESAAALEKFEGIVRRMELVGVKNNITVIDDFAHNPDKIAATLSSLKNFPGRLIIMFQPHGFGPLKLMGHEIAETFAHYMDHDDMLLMPEAYYAGGTTERAVTAKDVIETVRKKDRQAQWFAARDKILPFIKSSARAGDRIIIMGARDDTLSDFARQVLAGF